MSLHYPGLTHVECDATLRRIADELTDEIHKHNETRLELATLQRALAKFHRDNKPPRREKFLAVRVKAL